MTTDTLTSASPRRRRKRLATLILAALLLVFPVRFAVQLAADPEGPKDCPPLPPDDDRAKPAPLKGGHPSELPWLQRGGTVNDASCLSRTAVHGVIAVHNVEDVRRALAFARDGGLKVSVAGVKHSMGGHAFARGAVVLDMTTFKRMSLDVPSKTLLRRQRRHVARHSELPA